MDNKQTGIKDSTFGDHARIEINQHINSPLQNQAIPSNVRSGSKNFVGREEELKKIEKALTQGQGVIVCAVEGLGGVGKTELALQYAQRYKGEYAAQYWLNLREMGLAQAVVKEASRYIALPESMLADIDEAKAAWYWQKWLPAQGKLLVILDDVTDLKDIPQQARPLDDRFQLLVTTRRRKLGSQFVEIALEVISEAEALLLLRKLLGDARVERELTAAKEICRYLGYLPLGVELAGRYLQIDEDLKLADYQQQLHIADESLDLQEAEDIGATRGVIAAFELSWQELGETTSQVAMLLGLFDPTEIPWSLVEDVAKELNFGERDIREARKQLNNLYLLKVFKSVNLVNPVNEDKTRFTVHSLVREFMQWKLEQSQQANDFKKTFATTLAKISAQLPYQAHRDIIIAFEPNISHVKEVANNFIDYLNDEDFYKPLNALIRFYRDQGQYAAAIPWLMKRVEICESRHGFENDITASYYSNLGLIYVDLGNYPEAERLILKALEAFKYPSCKISYDLSNCLDCLATVYEKLERLDKSEYYYEQSLRMKRELFVTDEGKFNIFNMDVDQAADYASALVFLGRTLEYKGDSNSAINQYLEGLNILKLIENQTGKYHRCKAYFLDNLGTIFEDKKRYKEAQKIFEESLEIRLSTLEIRLSTLEIRLSTLGNNHPNVAISYTNLASLLDAQGEYEKAEMFFLKALEIKQNRLYKEHLSIFSALCHLSRFYRDRGNFTNAKKYLKDAAAICVSHEFKSISKKDLLKMASSLFDWAKSLYDLGKIAEINEEKELYAEAESFYNSALTILTECQGSDDQTTLFVSVQESFSDFLTNVIEQGKTAYLSDHPVTLKLIHEIQSRNE